MKKINILLIFVALLSGHAQAAENKNQKDVNLLVQNQTGYDVNQGSIDVQKKIEQLLAQPLTEDTAVTVAYLNSPVIKAELSSLGISEADMRESGILHNPTLSLKTRTSNEEGAKRNTEIEIKQDVFDVLLWPLRKRIANAKFKVSEYEIAHKMTDFIKEVRLAYFEWLTANHKQTIAQDYFKAQEASLELSNRQKEAGNINKLDLAKAQAVFGKAKIEWLKMKQETQMKMERLRTLLGLNSKQFFMDEVIPIPDLPSEDLNVAELERKAIENRLDLSMKRQEIKTLEQSLNLSGLGFLPDVEVGYNQEKDASGAKLKGVVVDGQVPLFNRKQAQSAGIKASIETAKHQLDAMEQQAGLEVRLAFQNLTTSRQVVEAYKESMPVYQQMVKETLYQYNFMLTDVFHLLESKQAELATKQEYADALKGYWDSRIELENAIGAKLPFKASEKDTNKQDDYPGMKDEAHHHGG